jgi:hypothetical protein
MFCLMKRRIFMNEAWIDPGILGGLGGILGGTMGILGAITGGLAGWFAPKGKYKKLVLGVNTFSFVLSLILLIIGIIAYLSGQPRGVWYGFGYCGLLCTVLFGIGFPVILKRYRDAELRKSMSEDLTLGGNEDVK